MIVIIKYKQGNLLKADVEALVNTVNCVGVMGKGIALQFKQAFPDNYTEYRKACRAESVKPGEMFITPTGNLFNPKFIINFPTKRHWKGKTRIKDIEDGLKTLTDEVRKLGIKSIAIPPLGCGNGGLNWKDVHPMIESAFSNLPELCVELYPPKGSPAPESIKIGTKKPKLTKARALFLALMENYAVPGYRLTLLEIQKLAYFLQESGEPLRLRFVKGKYGPYADNLNHVLQILDGHYIRGYGDRNRKAQIRILPDASDKALDFLSKEIVSLKRLNQVSNIIRGFETPYGLELLSTVHWVIRNNPSINSDSEKVIHAFHNWNERKKKLFKEQHIVKAWEHLNNRDIFK